MHPVGLLWKAAIQARTGLGPHSASRPNGSEAQIANFAKLLWNPTAATYTEPDFHTRAQSTKSQNLERYCDLVLRFDPVFVSRAQCERQRFSEVSLTCSD